jgi:hypothetical protein
MILYDFRYYIYPGERRSSGGSGPGPTNLSAKDERGQSQSPHSAPPSSHGGNPGPLSLQSAQQQKLKSSSSGSQPANLSSQKSSVSIKQELKGEEKEMKVKQEGQKPTMETQGPPPPPTSQYYLHPPYMGPGFGFDPSLPYRNMLVPSSPYNNPYHLQMSRFPTPEDLSRNTKALDLLQHHASQYYNTHKIHELSERAMKSPTSNVKVSVSSPNMQPQSQQQQQQQQQQQAQQNSSANNLSGVGSGSASNPQAGGNPQSGSSGSGGPPSSAGLNLQQAPINPNQSPGAIALNQNKALGDKGDRVGGPPGSELGKDGAPVGSRSPPPQRHVHTHHHTHVGLGYPMYPTPYGGKIL